MRELLEVLDQVVDEVSFIKFVNALAADRANEVAAERSESSSPYGPGKNGWENGTIEAFLDAAAAWASASMKGLPDSPKATSSWRRCADILHAGKFYE